MSRGGRFPRAPPPDQPLFKFSSHLRPIKRWARSRSEKPRTLLFIARNKESEKTKKKIIIQEFKKFCDHLVTNCSPRTTFLSAAHGLTRDVQNAGIPIPRDLIPIPRDWPFPGKKHFLPWNFPIPFPAYSWGILLIPREFPIPQLFPGMILTSRIPDSPEIPSFWK